MKRANRRKINRGRLRKIRLLFLVVCFLVISSPFSYVETNQRKNVLVLHSYHKGLGWNDAITQGIESVLHGSDQEIELFFEYMDTKRIYDAKYLQYLYELYSHKFRIRRFDVIISSDDHAFNFLLAHHRDLFPYTPVVFCGVNDFEDSMLLSHSLITGIVESFDIKSTIDVALQLQSNIKQVFVIVDKTLSGTIGKKLVIKAVPYFKDSVRFIFLEDFDISELQAKVKELPRDSVALLIHFTTDKSGNVFSHEKFCALISRYCAVPIYANTDSYLGHGSVGGMLVSGYAQGEKAGEIAFRILHGEKVENIPVIKQSPNRYMFDYLQIKRFGIKLSSLPKGSTVINRPYSFYWKYKSLFWSVIAGIAGLVLIILILATNIYSRKKAQEALLRIEERFDLAVKGSNDGLWDWQDISKNEVWFSPRLYELLGYENAEFEGSFTKFTELLHPEDRDKTLEAVNAHLEKRVPYDIEHRLKKKSGGYNWFRARGQAIWDEGGNSTRMAGSLQDITARKLGEKQIKASLKEKELLLREIHHRVKNNMQLITSLLRLQSAKIKDKQYLEMFKESQDRIKSMSLIHEKLYYAKDFANIDFKGYAKSLVNGLYRSHGVNTSKIALKIEVEGVSLGVDCAIPCGLIINELVSNSLKHAFPQKREGEIRIALRSINEGEFELAVSDDGVGLPKDLDFRNTESLGLHLVTILIEDQLNGKIELDRSEGIKYNIQFKKTIEKARI